jgi:hypothetical protein
MVIPSPLKRAVYYTEQRKLTYFVTDHAQATLYDITEAQARNEIKSMALCHKEIVQFLDIVSNAKI